MLEFSSSPGDRWPLHFASENVHPGPPQGSIPTPALQHLATGRVPRQRYRGQAGPHVFPSPALAQLTESINVLRTGGEAFVIAAGAELGGGFVG